MLFYQPFLETAGRMTCKNIDFTTFQLEMMRVGRPFLPIVSRKGGKKKRPFPETARRKNTVSRNGKKKKGRFQKRQEEKGPFPETP